MSLFRFINSYEDDLDPRTSRLVAARPADQRSVQPAVDIHETNDKYILHAELPGISKEKLDLNINDKSITIAGEFVSHRQEKDGLRGVFTERKYGKFTRGFNFPEIVDSAQAKASFKDGILVSRASFSFSSSFRSSFLLPSSFFLFLF
jgi:HSP20 family molecular chaperone IbpA